MTFSQGNLNAIFIIRFDFYVVSGRVKFGVMEKLTPVCYLQIALEVIILPIQIGIVVFR